MKTIAIVEDTIDNLEVIRYFLQKDYPGLILVGEARSVDEAYDLLVRRRPDIVLLDIQIMGGTSFDVLARLDADGHPLPHLIFITAHGVLENATKALRYAALDFIAKPIDENLLREAIDRAKNRLDAQDTMLDEIRAMLEQQRRGDRFDRIAIRLLGGIRRLVPVSDVMYFQADREVTKVFLSNGEMLVAAVNIGHYKRTLQEDYDFLLVHQSFLVNAGHIHQFDPRAGEIELSTGLRLATSQSGNALLRAYFQRKEGGESGPTGMLTRLRGLIGQLVQGRR
jgi:two-component system LytT family response regulator